MKITLLFWLLTLMVLPRNTVVAMNFFEFDPILLISEWLEYNKYKELWDYDHFILQVLESDPKSTDLLNIVVQKIIESHGDPETPAVPQFFLTRLFEYSPQLAITLSQSISKNIEFMQSQNIFHVLQNVKDHTCFDIVDKSILSVARETLYKDKRDVLLTIITCLKTIISALEQSNIADLWVQLEREQLKALLTQTEADLNKHSIDLIIF